MNSENMYCVIMAGGVGTRFWPMSTSKLPKQFHDVLGTGKTLIQATYERLLKLTDSNNIFVVTDKRYVNFVEEQIPGVLKENILAEPVGMNTAPCVLFASLKIHNLNPEAQLLVCPSDHLILDEQEFVKNVLKVIQHSKTQSGLYTLGISPSRPDSGYGYIQFFDDTDKPLKKVKTFTEKPDKELAKKFIKSGDFLWNSGIFIWSSKAITEAFQMYMPDMYQWFNKVSFNTDKEQEQIEEIYPMLTKTSIDVGIMEKAENVFVYPSDFGWSDLGTWTSLYTNRAKDEQENAITGKHVRCYNSRRNIIHMDEGKAAVIEGLEDYIIVDTPNSLLIVPLESDQLIKKYVSELKITKGDKFV